MVAWREVHERLRGRFFRVVTLILLVAVGAAVVIPTLNSNSTSSQRVGAVTPLSPKLRQEVDRAARSQSVAVHLVEVPSTDQLRSDLRSGTIDVGIDGRTSILLNKPLDKSGSATAQLATALAQILGAERAIEAAGLTADQATTLAHAQPLPIQSLQPASRRTPAQSTSVIGVILVFVMLTQYLTWTLMGVMEEKASRVVEVLLAALRPMELLGGKLLGIGLVALLQASLVVAFALILGKAVGSDLLHGTAPLVVVATLGWLVLGYIFYSWVYAAAGSLAERQDQVQSLVLPLSVPMIVGYIFSLTAAGSGNVSAFFRVLAFFPPTAPFAMPVLVALGETTWWQFVISAAISIVSTFAVARVGATIYRRAVLRTGGRVRLRAMLSR
jgi:ABC-2 type transport system permease protein